MSIENFFNFDEEQILPGFQLQFSKLSTNSNTSKCKEISNKNDFILKNIKYACISTRNFR